MKYTLQMIQDIESYQIRYRREDESIGSWGLIKLPKDPNRIRSIGGHFSDLPIKMKPPYGLDITFGRIT